MSCFRRHGFALAVHIAATMHIVTGNNINTQNTPSKGNVKKIICPYLSSAVEEGFLEVQNEYTLHELELAVLRGGIHPEDTAKVIGANFVNNPSGKMDIFNMEGAQNEHVSSTGITDCFSLFRNCTTKNGVGSCESETPNPDCSSSSTSVFDELVAVVDLNKDGIISLGELVTAERNKQFPVLDHNPLGLGTTYLSIFSVVRLFGKEDGSGITVSDFRKVMIDRKFHGLDSGYFWGRPCDAIIPKAAALLIGTDEDSCVPHSPIPAPDGCNTCMCPPLGLRSLADNCTKNLCVAGTTATTTKKPDPSHFPWAGSALTCKPGTVIGHKDRCNTCKCPASRRFADTTDCTKKNARKCRKIRRKRCVPGRRFMKSDGCTSCICPKRGLKRRAKVCMNTCQESYDYYARRLEMLV
eukprot:TRINITY_DN1668_c0_g1_i2.p1 TRINITY_DN1668_c0_g1~~TRINITY_DN1668_c0_g1_i2.p1  ORF type:complete len:411 (-),score=40.85 TRINITY_DN1668_c0_g1_i2:359-1591(-)